MKVTKLSRRQRQVLEYVARGYLQKETAVALGLSEHTVKHHMSTILRKLGAPTALAAVLMAIQRGYIAMPGEEEMRR